MNSIARTLQDNYYITQEAKKPVEFFLINAYKL